MIIIVALITIPVFFFDQFAINGPSMEPTLHTGDHVLVNKLLMGARIYKEYDFSHPELDSFRLPGFRRIRPGDIVVFNYPQGRNRDKIEFKINYVYAKRCIGTPGDSISIVDGYYVNHNLKGEILGLESVQAELRNTPDSILAENGNVFLPAIPYDMEYNWTIRNFGPLMIPERGDRLAVDSVSIMPYRQAIEYETGFRPVVMDGEVMLGDERIVEYVFKGNWYFFGGDNVLNSRDSRYVGLVPEEFIVGIATRILFSEDECSGKMDWGRMLKNI